MLIFNFRYDTYSKATEKESILKYYTIYGGKFGSLTVVYYTNSLRLHVTREKKSI